MEETKKNARRIMPKCDWCGKEPTKLTATRGRTSFCADRCADEYEHHLKRHPMLQWYVSLTHEQREDAVHKGLVKTFYGNARAL